MKNFTVFFRVGVVVVFFHLLEKIFYYICSILGRIINLVFYYFMQKKFQSVAADESSELIGREHDIYQKKNDIRSEYTRDYTRILHSLAFRRLKHKTQVFFNGADNDHICTRIEHVLHVESVACTIAKELGLNVELTSAIALAHDLGHAPFGHQGEEVLDNLVAHYLSSDFWHERNGLYLVDQVELLADEKGNFRNLDLTYAVRDGIISHCGELDDNDLRPRSEYIDLKDFDSKGKYQSYTWEGCVVKLADKIAYLGRDIEDAKMLGYFSKEQLDELQDLSLVRKDKSVNTTVIMHDLILDLCENSDPSVGLRLSPAMSEHLNRIKKFNYKNIYSNPRLNPYKAYSELVVSQLFEYLSNLYEGPETIRTIVSKNYERKQFVEDFVSFLVVYCYPEIMDEIKKFKSIGNKYKNKKIYGDLSDEKAYMKAIVDFIAGMTDIYAVKCFDELLRC